MWARSLCVLGLSIVAAIGAAAPTMAATSHIFSGGLSAGRSYGSNARHSNPVYTRVNSNHTACGAVDQTMNGYAWRPPDVFSLSTCGPGVTTTYFGSLGGLWHGAVFNPNVSTADSISNSYFAW